MRRFAALISLAVLAACSTAGGLSDIAPTASETPRVAVRKPRFEDAKPHEWESGAPWTYAVHGTDVAKYQTDIDWASARDSGISFAFIKATEGGDRYDENFERHWAGTRAAGIPRGAYHFFYFCRPASEQAQWFIDHVPKEHGALPPVLDMEWNPHSPTCRLRPPAATVRAEMKTFLTMVERHFGKKPIIYTSVDFFDDNDLSTFGGYPYWLRSVAGHPREKYGSHPFTFWQYTGTGIVPGMTGKSDINVFNGSEAAWNKWLRQNTR